MKHTATTLERAAASVKDQLTDTAAEYRYLDRKQRHTSDKLINRAQTEIITLSIDGRKSDALCPCWEKMSLRDNLMLIYVLLNRSGIPVSRLRLGIYRKTGQRCWCFQLSADPNEHKTFPTLWKSVRER